MNDFKYISKVGLELEGGWCDSEKSAKLVPDGSVHANDFEFATFTGEMILNPPVATRNELFEFMEKNWPDEVTDRCGFHVHTSFQNMAIYARLMDGDFFEHFRNKMQKWGKEYPCKNKKFWERFEDKNQFCKKNFIPEQQVLIKQKGTSIRYTQLNYCYSFHKTIECRLFPMFDHFLTAKAALEAYLDCIESFLDEHPLTEQHLTPLELKIEDDSPEFPVEEDIVITNDMPPFKIQPFNMFRVMGAIDKKPIAITSAPKSKRTKRSGAYKKLVGGWSANTSVDDIF